METEKLLEYENLNEETRTMLNKAMDIYALIKDKEIIKDVKKTIGRGEVEFTKQDKKVFSLYLASFIADTPLKEILEDFDDIKIKDMLNFIDIEEEIPALEENYEQFYNNNFKYTLLIMQDSAIKYDESSSKINPEMIFLWLDSSMTTNSKIIEYYMNTYAPFAGILISDHPSFKIVKQYAKQNGTIKTSPQVTFRRPNAPFVGLFDHFIDPNTKEEEQPELLPEKFDINNEKLWDILEDIKKKFIGQEATAEDLFYNIVNNQDLAYQNNTNDGQRSIIFLDGPTGTGKTAITREITEQLDIPFISTSVTKYSATGYVGGDLTDILKDLLKKADGDVEKAQRGIVVLDEFDKLAYNNREGQTMKQAVQQQLLDFMGGGKYNVSTGMGLFGGSSTEFDTSKLTFVCLGALTKLREDKQDPKQAIGFGEQIPKVEGKEYSITPQDLMDLGLERELVGRFNTYLHTEEYSKESLLKILKESTISPLIGFEKWIASKNKQLNIEEGTYEAIVDAAYELNTGARSLQTVMNNIRTPFLKEVLRGTDTTITLDERTVRNINENTINRKGRK